MFDLKKENAFSHTHSPRRTTPPYCVRTTPSSNLPSPRRNTRVWLERSSGKSPSPTVSRASRGVLHSENLISPSKTFQVFAHVSPVSGIPDVKGKVSVLCGQTVGGIWSWERPLPLKTARPRARKGSPPRFRPHRPRALPPTPGSPWEI
jgi:hypothetical protein